MGLFSKTCEYAMRAVFYIASHSLDGSRPGIKEIAENINSPEHFLAKILQKLSKGGIVSSIKGPNGGFFIEPQGLNRPLADIITCLEGDQIFTGCGMGLSYCSESNPCPLHHEFKKVRNQLTHMLYQTTIGEFNGELRAGALTLNK
ncbi:RrF2 family transcriptional regulator [Sphingobacterium faecale]|uniref:Rrf2 family transcriptional regulator n=1 Tax=Sphingobacterium faecale TaxID=2803775 RepID=A0ABS1QXV9_9SPHI|nr:Rrf2 family transcriptional regulator [Sphingobacterium faecale]MBL1407129.1 Rrf2 family transcriptional regulator [Sphingobacterium faecale]